MTLLKHTLQQNNLVTILIMIYTFIDNFLKQVLRLIFHAIECPKRNHPPTVSRFFRGEGLGVCSYYSRSDRESSFLGKKKKE